MDGHSLWAEEPADIPRLTEDVPNRSKRMKTLGNAVSPPQVFPILKYIAKYTFIIYRNGCRIGTQVNKHTACTLF